MGEKGAHEPRLYLTFDDGPDPTWTPRVLDALAEIEAPATFFVIAGEACRHPEVVERAIAEGHSIALHCVEHVDHREMSAEEGAHEARTGVELLRSRFGAGFVPLWRPPFGSIAPWTEEAAESAGLRVKLWTVDTGDWRGHTAEEIIAAVRPRLRDASVLLMHDAIGQGAPRRGAEETVRLLPRLAEIAGGFLRFEAPDTRP